MKLRAILILLASFASACVVTSDSQVEYAQVRISALRFMMMKHADSGMERQHYAFYVIRDSAYVAHFRGIVPRVVPFEEERFSMASGRAVEVETGKQVKIWSVTGAVIREDKAEVGVSWASGDLGVGLHTVFLEKKDKRWIAVSERLDAVAKTELNQSRQPMSTAVTFCADAQPAAAILVAAK